MRAEPIDDLDQLFQQAQADLPPQLKARLLAIPRIEAAQHRWDVQRILPFLTLLPAACWLVFLYGPTWVHKIIAGLQNIRMPAFEMPLPAWPAIPALEMTLPAWPTLSPMMILAGSTVLVVLMTVGAWLYFEHEGESVAAYAQRLTASS